MLNIWLSFVERKKVEVENFSLFLGRARSCNGCSLTSSSQYIITTKRLKYRIQYEINTLTNPKYSPQSFANYFVATKYQHKIHIEA